MESLKLMSGGKLETIDRYSVNFVGEKAYAYPTFPVDDPLEGSEAVGMLIGAMEKRGFEHEGCDGKVILFARKEQRRNLSRARGRRKPI